MLEILTSLFCTFQNSSYTRQHQILSRFYQYPEGSPGIDYLFSCMTDSTLVLFNCQSRRGCDSITLQDKKVSMQTCTITIPIHATLWPHPAMHPPPLRQSQFVRLPAYSDALSSGGSQRRQLPRGLKHASWWSAQV